MANYNESAVAGDRWTRAAQLIISNPHDGNKSIRAVEEEIAVFEDGRFARMADTNLPIILEELTEENALTQFPLLHPETLQPLGGSATYQDVAVLMTSLYMHLAKERDLLMERGPSPYPSWVYNEESQQWEAPLPRPADYWWVWDESSQQWVDTRPPMPDDGQQYEWVDGDWQVVSNAP